MNKWFSQFLSGFFAPWRGAKLILDSKRLMAVAALPALINTVIYLLILWLFGGWLFGVATSWASSLSSVFFVLAMIAVLFFFLLLIAIDGLMIALLARIFAAPFNDPLALATEKHLGIHTQKDKEGGPVKQVFSTTVDILLEVKKVGILGAFAIVVSLLSLIPGVAIVTWPIASFFLSIDFLDYPLARRGYGIKSQFAYHRAHWSASLGFGVSLSLVVPVPILGFFFLPLAVVGGTELFSKLETRV